MSRARTARVDRPGCEYGSAVDDIVAVPAEAGLSVVGIFAYAFMSKREGMASSPEDAGTQEGELAVAVAEAVRQRGVDLEIVAGGSSPTGRYVAAVEGHRVRLTLGTSDVSVLNLDTP